jgi:hypothetical protein
MEIILNLLNAEFTKESHWFIQAEVEQTSYPSKQKSKEKQRTDIFFGFSNKFLKSYFNFKASLSNRIIIKLGAIEVQGHKMSSKPDPSKCVCQGLYSLVITRRLLAALRDNASIRETYHLTHPTTKAETCSVTLLFSLNFSGTEEKIIENERKFLKVSFDHYEIDENIIKNKTTALESLLREKADELQEWMKKVDDLSNAIRSLGAEVALLKKEKDFLEVQNKEIEKKIGNLSSVEDFHIKVDMLSNSSQGLSILREMLVKTERRLNHQRVVYDELARDWGKIEGKKKKLELLKNEVEKVKEAQSQLEFHTLSLKDQLPQALSLRENVKSLDGLIKEFEVQIAKSRTIQKDKASEAEVYSLKHRKALLHEKQKQVQIILELNQGYLPLEELEKLNLDHLEDDNEKSNLQKRGEKLLAEVERLGIQLSRASVASTFRPQSKSNLIELQVKLQAAEARVDAMQERMNDSAANHAREVAKYEATLAKLDAKIVTLNNSFN